MSYSDTSVATVSNGMYGDAVDFRPFSSGGNYEAESESQQREARRRFGALLKEWQADTADLSSLSAITNHPSYKQIIGLGPKALQFIFDELERAPNYWFDALRSITHDDPVRPEDRGNLQAMKRAWLDWAADQEYV